jgi:hypothetical protein
VRSDEELLQALRSAVAPDATADPARVAALHAAAQALPPADPVRRPSGLPRAITSVAAAAAAVLLVAAGAALTPFAERDRGTPEFTAALTGGPAEADVEGLLVDFGRVVELRTDELPVLPKGEFYELWFVAGEGTTGPQRISAGTFHPDEQGRTDVALFAAVDPELYPLVEVTAEPGTGQAVLRGRVQLV